MRIIRPIIVVAVLALMAVATAFYFRPLEVYDAIFHYHLWRAGVRSEYVRLGSYRIHYLEDAPKGLSTPVGIGAHADRPIVLVHGLGGRAEDWQKMIEGLAANGFHVYALDLLGFGSSDKPDVNYSIAIEEDILRQFIDSQQLTRVDLGGWSMGGWVAMDYALDHPDRVRRLLLYDSAGLAFQSAMPLTKFIPKDSADLTELMGYLSPHPRALPPFVVADVLRLSRRDGWVMQRGLDSAADNKGVLDGKLGALRMPVLIIWGAEDRLIPLSIGEELHQQIPQSVLEIANGCGHLAASECASKILPRTVQFLNAQPPMAGGQSSF